MVYMIFIYVYYGKYRWYSLLSCFAPATKFIYCIAGYLHGAGAIFMDIFKSGLFSRMYCSQLSFSVQTGV